MNAICPICGQHRFYGDRHQNAHRYQSKYRSSINKAPRNEKDLLILKGLEDNLSYTQIGNSLGVSRQRIGQLVARMGIYRDVKKSYKKA